MDNQGSGLNGNTNQQNVNAFRKIVNQMIGKSRLTPFRELSYNRKGR